MSFKKFASSADRNKGPIYEALQRLCIETTTIRNVLEIGSGSGQHAAFMSAKMPSLRWQPTEFDQSCLDSIVEWTKEINNVLPPLALDASLPAEQWPVPALHYDLIYNCNVIHISPYKVLEGLIGGAERVCKEGALLVMYGPMKINGKPTTDSNEQFDQWLKARDPDFGLRDFEDVNAKASKASFEFVSREDMPANNFLSVWRKKDG